MTAIITPATAALAIPAALPGDTLTLEGVFPTLPLKYRKPNLTLDCTKAEFTGMVRTGDATNPIDGLHLIGGLYRAGIVLSTGRNVSVTGAAFEGGDARMFNGVTLVQIAGAKVKGNKLRDCLNGLVLSEVSDFEVDDNDLERIRKDVINVSCCQRGKIRRNASRDHRPLDGDHPDAIQMLNILGKPATCDLDIEDNDFTIKGGQGITQTWKVSKGDPRFARIAYRRNHVIAGMPYGFGMIGVDDGTLEGNTLEAHPGSPYPVRFVVDPSCTQIKWIGKNLQGPFGTIEAVSWPPTAVPLPPTPVNPRILELEAALAAANAKLAAEQAADAVEDAEYEARIQALGDEAAALNAKIAKAREDLA